MKEMKIDRYSLDKDLAHQPGKYAWWASLLASVEERRDYLEEKLDRLNARLAIAYRGKYKATELKHRILLDSDYRELQEKVRVWKASERFLKGAVRGFDHRLEVLRSLAANTRRGKHEA